MKEVKYQMFARDDGKLNLVFSYGTKTHQILLEPDDMLALASYIKAAVSEYKRKSQTDT